MKKITLIKKENLSYVSNFCGFFYVFKTFIKILDFSLTIGEKILGFDKFNK